VCRCFEFFEFGFGRSEFGFDDGQLIEGVAEVFGFRLARFDSGNVVHT
jgi:hypothetical protein